MDQLYDISSLAANEHMQQRVAAAIAKESNGAYPVPPPETAEQEAWGRRWDWASTPTWAEKYRYALDTGVENPGVDPGVISDADISAWVTSTWPLTEQDSALPAGQLG